MIYGPCSPNVFIFCVSQGWEFCERQIYLSDRIYILKWWYILNDSVFIHLKYPP